MQLIFTALSLASVVSYTVDIPPMRSTVQRHLAYQLSFSSRKRYIQTRLFQSMGFANDVDNGESPTNYNNNDDDDALKWEKLYNSGTTSKSSLVMQTANTEVPPSPISSDIRVITFDLDNTIWKTMTTISDANDALSSHLLNKFGIQGRSEKIMGQLFKENPDRYAGVDHKIAIANEDDDKNNGDDDYANIVQNVGHTDFKAGSTGEEKDTNNNADNDNGVHIQSKVTKKKPVYLTLLRKDAIRSLIIQQTKVSTDNIDVLDVEDQVDAAFEIWADARCESISNNFAPCAVEILNNLKSQLAESSSQSSTSSSLQKVYIGAITDGNSNPNKVPQLNGVFDFVIRAEDVGVSKPDKRVYKAAVAALMLRLGQDGRSTEEFFLGEENIEDGVVKDTFIMPPSADEGRTTTTTPSWKDIDEDAVEAFSDAVGPWWVHIGDDFFKDIVAAKECQMRTVWTRELIGGSANDRAVKEDEESGKKKQRSVDDLLKDVSKSDGVLKMAIGASDFLTESLQDEFCDAILDRFENLGGLLTQWHTEGKGVKQDKRLDEVNLLEMKELGASIRIPSGSEASMSNGDTSGTTSPKSHKFCVYCGEKLPSAATFCSSCGEKVA